MTYSKVWRRWFHTGRSACIILLCLVTVLTGCLVRRRERLPAVIAASANWQTATLQQLLEKVNARDRAIDTLSLTATVEPSVGSVNKGEIVHYRDVRTFVLIRKPAFLRMIGLYPVVQNTAFDMTSNGDVFQLYIPSKNRFIIGRSKGPEIRSKSTLENMRPEVMLDALLVRGPAEGEQAVLEAFVQGDTAYYIIHIISTRSPAKLDRNIWFERKDLKVVRQQVFDDSGNEVTSVRYSDESEIAGFTYPKQIAIDRPKDLFGLILTITNAEFNQPLPDEKFEMQQPQNVQITDLRDPQQTSQAQGER